MDPTISALTKKIVMPVRVLSMLQMSDGSVEPPPPPIYINRCNNITYGMFITIKYQKNNPLSFHVLERVCEAGPWGSYSH